MSKPYRKMFKPVPVGVYNFKDFKERGYYYVDKTLLIKELLDRGGKVTLFTRPRRFGKTLNMYMLKYFFEMDIDSKTHEVVDNSSLFDGLKIMSAGEEYTKHMGKYPVIFLSLNVMKQMYFDSAVNMLKSNMADEFSRHSYLLDKLDLSDKDKDFYYKMSNKQGTADDCKEALLIISRLLKEYHGVGPVILIDEYDVPLQYGYEQGPEYYGKVLDLIRSMFEQTFKNNPYLSFGVLTGCLRVSRESIFTGMNNLEIVSIMTTIYGEYFGFTDEEVVKMMNDFGVAEKIDEAREWYDGYIFGEANIYNPWSFIQYVQAKTVRIDSFPIPYWANTSSNSIVKDMISHIDEDTKEELEMLVNGGKVTKPVHEDITYAELEYSPERHDEYMDNLYNFMFFTGYFRKVGESNDGIKKYVTLAIPNKEVLYIFDRHITSWFGAKMQKVEKKPFYTAVIEQDTDTMEEMISDTLYESISFFDYGESFYHGIVIGLLRGMPRYVARSNRESGMGRYDLVARPISPRKTVYIFEFKVVKNDADMESAAEEALKQIEENDYEAEFRADGYKQFIHYGVAFWKKECVVRTKQAAKD